MSEPMALPRWARAAGAALLITVVTWGVACNMISGADAVDFTGESTGSSSSSGNSSGSSGSSSGSGGEGPMGNPNSCPGASVNIDPGETLPLIHGDTTGATDKFKEVSGNYPSCKSNCDCVSDPSYNGRDLVYAVTPSASGTLSVTLDATYADWQLNVRTKCDDDPANEVGCVWGNNPGNSANNPNNLSVFVAQGTTYYVVANSWNGAFFGPFTLQLSLQ